MFHSRALTFFSSLVWFCASAPAYAQSVPAGTIITGAAEAEFDTPSGRQTITSNAAQVQVAEVLSVAVTSIDQGPIAVQSGGAVLSFELTNTGNGNEAFTLTANPAVNGNDFDMTVEIIAADSNGNGVFDPGVDIGFTGPEQTTPLAPGETRLIFVRTSVPPSASSNQSSRLELRAEPATGGGPAGTVYAGQGDGGVDAVATDYAATGAATGAVTTAQNSLQLLKSASVQDPFGGTSAIPGSVITYTIDAELVGTGSISNLEVTDQIPAGTVYLPGSLALDGTALSDATGDDAGDADGSRIAVSIPSLIAGPTRSITFRVEIQ